MEGICFLATCYTSSSWVTYDCYDYDPRDEGYQSTKEIGQRTYRKLVKSIVKDHSVSVFMLATRGRSQTVLTNIDQHTQGYSSTREIIHQGRMLSDTA